MCVRERERERERENERKMRTYIQSSNGTFIRSARRIETRTKKNPYKYSYIKRMLKVSCCLLYYIVHIKH